MYVEKFKNICEKDNVTITNLCKYVNIDRSTLGKYLSGYLVIPLKHLNSICNYFNYSIDYVFDLVNIQNYKNSRKEINKQIFQKQLKEFRKDKKISQEKMGKILKCSHSVISNYENGLHLISSSNLYTICKKYNISADYLLGKIDSLEEFNKAVKEKNTN